MLATIELYELLSAIGIIILVNGGILAYVLASMSTLKDKVQTKADCSIVVASIIENIKAVKELMATKLDNHGLLAEQHKEFMNTRLDTLERLIKNGNR